MLTALFGAFLFLVGISLGSFFNVVVSRLAPLEAPANGGAAPTVPRGLPLTGLAPPSPFLAGRSRCDHCGTPLRWFELIPLASFAIQSGHCRSCARAIPFRYPLLELLTGVAVVLIGLAVFSGALMLPFASRPASLLSQIGTLAYYSLFTSLALAISVYDFEQFLVPRAFVLPLLAVGLLVHLWAVGDAGTVGDLWFILATAASGYLFFAAISVLSKGRAMGLGDAEVASVLAFYLPPVGVALAVILAFLSGAALGSALALVKKLTWGSRIAFTPFLCFGALLSLLWGNGIIEWYLGLFG